MKIKAPFLLFPVLLATSAAARAEQSPPDAGALRQQIERNLQPRLPPKTSQDIQAPPPPLQSLGTATVTVERFRIEGATLVDEATLQSVLSPYLHRPLGFQELQRAALAVSGSYRQAGWIARVYLPRQEIAAGVVVLQVVEAQFAGIRIAGEAPTHVRVDRIREFIDAEQPVGAPLNADALDRALLLVDDLPGVSATGNLAAGEGASQTVAVLELQDEPWVAGAVDVDNTGARSTGAWELSGNLMLNSPARVGDALSLDLIHARGSDYGRLGYSLPLGSTGLRASLDASSLDYRLVSADFSALRARGSSTTYGAALSYPVLRSRFRNLFASLDVDDKQYDNHANGTVTSHYRVNSWTAGLNGNAFDSVLGGGATTASLALQAGRVELGGSPGAATDAATVRTGGNFTKLRFMASRQQTLTETWSIYAALQGQHAGKNLDSSEKFYLGGANGVRAYPTSEAGGSDGQLVNLEARARLPHGFNALGFFDWGHVTVNHDNRFDGAARVNNITLKGAGVGAGWFAANGSSVKATYAHRLGHNPNPSANGSDDDGSLTKNRFWLAASLPF